MDYEQWQRVEEEKIDRLSDLVQKIENGSKIDVWEVVPELELKKSKLVWGMLDPKSIREGYLLSRPQVFLLPINAPQYEGWTFKKEYGHSPSWLAELIRKNPDRIKPVITAQPLDYKPHAQYNGIFRACDEVYKDDYPPCSQWRVEALIAKYRTTLDDQFKEYYSNEYFRLGKNHWASEVMRALGFARNMKPESIEGRHLRHFLAVCYGLACLGLRGIVEHVIDASSRMPKASPKKKMESAWRILDPYSDYLVDPLRSDLGGLSLKSISKIEAAKRLQLVLPFMKEGQNLTERFMSRLRKKFNAERQYFELTRNLKATVPLEFILRLNFASESHLFLPRIKEVEKSELGYVMKEESEYSTNLYQVWQDLYRKGKVEKRMLDRLSESSAAYTEGIKEIAGKKLIKKVRIEKSKIVAGAFASGLSTSYGLTRLQNLSLQAAQVPEAALWLLETTLSLMSAAQTVRSLIKMDEVAKDNVSNKLKKSILKGNIVDFEMLHSLPV